LLAETLVLVLVRLVELSHRSGVVGVLGHLCSFFKRPLGSEKHDFFQQFSQLLNWAEQQKNRQGDKGTS
jgi:hypothetical protein